VRALPPLRIAAMSLVLLGALTGCLRSAPIVHPGPDVWDVPPCADRSDLRVEDLAVAAKAKCDHAGIVFEWPDGYQQAAPEIGVSHGSADSFETPTYTLINMGAWGIVAAVTDPEGTHTDWWGDETAVKHIQDQDGTFIPPMLEQ